jgi:hypothetical protein
MYYSATLQVVSARQVCLAWGSKCLVANYRCILPLCIFLQVGNVMAIVEGYLQQQQQQQQQQRAHSGSSSKHEASANSLLQNLTNILACIGIADRGTDAMQAAWRGVARPTAGLLKHMMHVQLLQPAENAAQLSADRDQRPPVWQTVTGMLWYSDEGAVQEIGPLLRAVLPTQQPAEELAAAAAAEDAAAPAAAVPGDAGADAAAARLKALFSMCISAVKLLRQQMRARSPYAPTAPGFLSPAAALEQIQQAAVVIIQHHSSVSSGGMQAQDGAAYGSCVEAALLLPWAMLVLRCVQLSTVWAQQAAAGLQPSSSSSRASASSAAADEDSWAGKSVGIKQQLGNALKCLQQVQDGLQVVSRAFCGWCALPSLGQAVSADGSDAEQPAVVVLQLQQELLPAVQSVLPQHQMHAESSSTNSNALTATQLQLQAAGTSLGSRDEQQPAEACGSMIVTWRFSRAAVTATSTVDGSSSSSSSSSSSAAQLLQQPLQEEGDSKQLCQKTAMQEALQALHSTQQLMQLQLQHPDEQEHYTAALQALLLQQQSQRVVLPALQQLLSGGELQAWLAASSQRCIGTALVLQQPQLQQPGHSRQQCTRQ